MPHQQNDIEKILTPIDIAIDELARRKADRGLVDAVCAYLEHDIPTELTEDQLQFYLPRHLATPSLEISFARELVCEKGARLIVGEDWGGKFVGHNELKRPLGKLPIVIGRDRNGRDITVNKTVIDFQEAQGRSLSDITTVFGCSLPELHRHILQGSDLEGVIVVNESNWIDRHARNDVSKQYRRMLAYSCAHVIMLEWFTSSEYDFIYRIILPEFFAIMSALGVKPLIVELLNPEKANKRNWNAYPEEVLPRLEALEEKENRRAVAR